MQNSISEQIRNNNLKVFFLITILTVIVGLLGTLISNRFHWGLTGTGSFLVAAGIINFLGYFFSDRIVLRIANAKKLPKNRFQNYTRSFLVSVQHLAYRAQKYISLKTTP